MYQLEFWSLHLSHDNLYNRFNYYFHSVVKEGLPWWLSGKESACNAGDVGSIPGLEDRLEKEMTTHSSTHAWSIPWTEEPGKLQSMGLQESGTQLSDYTTTTVGEEIEARRSK